jgi:parallel beta-helix repeat protein
MILSGFGNTVEGNEVRDNRYRGIYISPDCEDNILSSNIVSRNPGGLRIFKARSNSIFANNFVGNDEDVSDTGTNNWDDGRSGNYYSSYVCRDDNLDDICDQAYAIPDGQNLDRFPHAEQFRL